LKPLDYQTIFGLVRSDQIRQEKNWRLIPDIKDKCMAFAVVSPEVALATRMGGLYLAKPQRDAYTTHLASS